MRIGSQTGYAGGLGMTSAEVYRTMSDYGITSVDYSLMNGYQSDLWKLSDSELKTRMTEIRKIINDNGVIVGQSHSPMDANYLNAPETKDARWHAQIQAIKAASWLGCPYITIHPICPSFRKNKHGMEETKEINMAFYTFLKPYLVEYNVKAAIENLFAWDPVRGILCETSCSTPAELCDYIDTLGTDHFCACLDVGHAVLACQDPVGYIYALGKERLHALHIHDNSYLGDNHLMPGMGKLDWWGIGKALNDIGYEDVFNYESDPPYSHFNIIGDLPTRKKLVLDLMRCYAELGRAITSVR
ncbi:MAG: sugar phosphate isomerase/epimerase [Clostridia bacterium]|nr:sugar phosphate isomerase/epimerase [Clostridia bacterium]